ncbi:hypothetical protein [Bradyrhizobium sp. LTSP885]|uniref:hypothetical protein n=1 Tax=Bradyrhizobium sp. LTSP885 TaxID=1619232 RepID=UPI0012DFFBB5|nr:hypothetical protein [Bradyrhizobium sp. LTSP885]
MDQKLASLVLAQLSKIEVRLEPGDSVLVQPTIAGMRVENPMDIIPGYDWEQIHNCLVSLARHGYIGTGQLSDPEVSVGIYFSGITPAGRRLMSSRAAS